MSYPSGVITDGEKRLYDRAMRDSGPKDEPRSFNLIAAEADKAQGETK